STGELSPVANITVSATGGSAPLTVAFSPDGSRAPGRGDRVVEYEWDFDGDGRTDSREPTPSFTYTENGRYTATLTVIGSSGRRSFPAGQEIVIGNTPPHVEI